MRGSYCILPFKQILALRTRYQKCTVSVKQSFLKATISNGTPVFDVSYKRLLHTSRKSLLGFGISKNINVISMKNLLAKCLVNVIFLFSSLIYIIEKKSGPQDFPHRYTWRTEILKILNFIAHHFTKIGNKIIATFP